MDTQGVTEKFYGVKTFVDETTVNSSISTTFKEIVPNNPGRLSLNIINNGASDIYVWYNEQVSTTKGFLVPASGGVLILKMRDFPALVTRAWYGLTASGTSTVQAVADVILS